MENKSMKQWAIEAIETAEAVAVSMNQTPEAAASSMAAFAEKLAAEQARREALGQPSLVGLRFAEDRGATMLAQALEDLGRHATSLARAGALPPSGPAWGAYRAFFQNAVSDGKRRMMVDLVEISDVNRPWQEAGEQLGKDIGLRWATSGKPKKAASEQARRPADDFASEELEFFNKFQNALGSPLRVGVDSEPGQEALAAASIFASVAEAKAQVTALEVRTGVEWRSQQLSARMFKAKDIQLRSAAVAAFDMAQRAALTPESDPSVGAGMGALLSMMSVAEAKTFLENTIKPHFARDPSGGGWGDFIAKQSVELDAKWKAGVSSAGPRQPLGRPEFLIPGSVPFGGEAAYLGAKFQEGQAKIKANISQGAQNLTGAAKRRLSGFVESFSAAAFAPRVEPVLDEAASVGLAPQEPAKRFSLGAFRQGAQKSIVSVIDRANAWTDQTEAAVKAKGRSVVVAGASALDSVVEGVSQNAQAARDRFQGKVGEAKASAGLVAFALSDRLGQSSTEPQKTKAARQAAAHVAAVAGALFVGVTMAPVAGLLAATVGAAAAGVGLASALKKAGEAFREKTSALPPALESLGQRLGAKREAAATAAPAEPAVSAPGI